MKTIKLLAITLLLSGCVSVKVVERVEQDNKAKQENKEKLENQKKVLHL